VKELSELEPAQRRRSVSEKYNRLAFFALIRLAFFLSAAVFLYLHRFDRPMLFYYGASPQDVPQGTAIPFFNPFRDRNDERLAEWLIRDLRTGRCEQIARERLQVDPGRICRVVRDTTKASLIWAESRTEDAKWKPSRQLIYDLPERKARLSVYFGMDEDGWGVRTTSLLQ
jgi:hypothetical protein